MDVLKLTKSQLKTILENDSYYDEDRDEEVELTTAERMFAERAFDAAECDECGGIGYVEREESSQRGGHIVTDEWREPCGVCGGELIKN